MFEIKKIDFWAATKWFVVFYILFLVILKLFGEFPIELEFTSLYGIFSLIIITIIVMINAILSATAVTQFYNRFSENFGGIKIDISTTKEVLDSCQTPEDSFQNENFNLSEINLGANNSNKIFSIKRIINMPNLKIFGFGILCCIVLIIANILLGPLNEILDNYLNILDYYDTMIGALILVVLILFVMLISYNPIAKLINGIKVVGIYNSKIFSDNNKSEIFKLNSFDILSLSKWIGILSSIIIFSLVLLFILALVIIKSLFYDFYYQYYPHSSFNSIHSEGFNYLKLLLIPSIYAFILTGLLSFIYVFLYNKVFYKKNKIEFEIDISS